MAKLFKKTMLALACAACALTLVFAGCSNGSDGGATGGNENGGIPRRPWRRREHSRNDAEDCRGRKRDRAALDTRKFCRARRKGIREHEA